ncbi:hypothetical protein KPSA3_05107 [Pseudomonas syringae pv. actinidiae]|uniref:Uncharacterized protein n=1 Tax=Pseudomonas syringae pv. actinidiae TaxID=103796 RepID=A0AAN4Q8V9_PSESF|nr:hypothetical protein KPSA3_05107 [Pseudomonas syringae pv. actinidiae]
MIINYRAAQICDVKRHSVHKARCDSGRTIMNIPPIFKKKQTKTHHPRA